MLGLDEGAWPAFYGNSEAFYRDVRLLPRFGVWFFGSFPMMCVIVAWQLRRGGDTDAAATRREIQRSAPAALGGLVLASLCAVWYYGELGRPTREVITGTLSRPYLVVAALGAALQFGAWLSILRGPPHIRVHLCVAGFAGAITIVAGAVVREAVRLSATDVSTLFDEHAGAARVGGLAVFLFFAVMNAGVIVWCVVLARGVGRATKTGSA